MVVACAQQLVDNVTIIGQQNQPLTWLVQPSNGKIFVWILDRINDVVLYLCIGGADDAQRFPL